MSALGYKQTRLPLAVNHPGQPGHDHTGMGSCILGAAPVRMLPGVCAPAQAPEVEMLSVALHEEAVGNMP
jgi:hypothetical protein